VKNNQIHIRDLFKIWRMEKTTGFLRIKYLLMKLN